MGGVKTSRQVARKVRVVENANAPSSRRPRLEASVPGIGVFHCKLTTINQASRLQYVLHTVTNYVQYVKTDYR